MSEHGRTLARGVSLAAASLILLTGCGQTGKLYLPGADDAQGEVVTRPTQTPPPDSGTTSNSPQSVDSPPAPDTPAPEVTTPEEKDDKKAPPKK